MTTQSALAAGSRRRIVPALLPSRVAFYLQASIVLFFLASSSAPTPLYSLYQHEWGFSPITTTVIFGIYAIAVLGALLVVGSLSDHIGRRPVLLGSLALQAVTMVVFAHAGGVVELSLARVIQGLATGAAVGAIGAGMLDIDPQRGALTNSVAPMLGTASGALLAGVLVQYAPSPTTLVYYVLGGIFVVQLIAVGFMNETVTRKAGAVASLRPEVRVPPAAKRAFWSAVPVLIAAWSMAGFYGSLGPALVRTISGSSSFVLAGLGFFVIAGSGALLVTQVHARSARTIMAAGSALLLVGTGISLIAIEQRSLALFIFSWVVSGSGFGAGVSGAIRTIVPLAHPHERSATVSSVFVVSYLAMGLPAIIAGFLVVHGGGLIATSQQYGIAAMVLAGIALFAITRPQSAVATVPATAVTLPTQVSREEEVLELA